MSVINKIASALNRRDEVPNQELAKELLAKKNVKGIQELVDHLADKNKNIQSDCIKVLYEIGEQNPSLISMYVNDFIALLNSKNNRLQWGAMTALKTITLEKPAAIFKSLPKLIDIAEKGSVITKDNLMSILIQLCSLHQYAKEAFALFNEQLQSGATNQLPMYAENALPLINEKNKAAFIKILTSRLDDFEKESKRKRVEKVLKKLKDK